MKKRIYVASPFGFSEAGRLFLYERIIPVFEEAGLDVIDPWSLTPVSMINSVLAIGEGSERKNAWKDLNIVIAENNKRGIDCCDGLFAVLDGVDVDSGTASEIGYAAALKKPVTAYRGDFRSAGDNEGSIVNLQVEYFIFSSGGRIISSLKDMKEEIVRLFISSSL
jgi:nucleoside 2-deoxyribosyltransferase